MSRRETATAAGAPAARAGSKAAQRPRLVVDCDPGCDDALALLLAFHAGTYERFDIVTVAGNVGIEQVTANALRICALAARYGLLPQGKELAKKVRIHRGAAVSLRGERPNAASVHGRDGLGDVPVRVLFDGTDPQATLARLSGPASNARGKATGGLVGCSAAQFYAREASKPTTGPNAEPDLVCTGPLTNLALALGQLPVGRRHAFWKRWRRVLVMGGALGVPGNVSYAAEFNTHSDPDAFKLVLESWNEHVSEAGTDSCTPLVLVPLDVTEQVVLWADEERLERVRGQFRQATYCLLRKYFLFHAVSYTPPLGAISKEGEVIPRGVRYPPKNANWLNAEQQIEARKWVQRKFTKSRRQAASGLTVLPRWCFLHDPTAIWLALSWEELRLQDQFRMALADGQSAFLRRTFLRVDVGPDDERGHLLETQPRGWFLSQDEDARGDLHRVVLASSAVPSPASQARTRRLREPQIPPLVRRLRSTRQGLLGQLDACLALRP